MLKHIEFEGKNVKSALEKASKIKRYLVDQDETLSSRVALCQPVLGDTTQIMLGF